MYAAAGQSSSEPTTSRATARHAKHTIIASFTVGYDPDGKINALTRNVPSLPHYDGNYTFAYNDRGELTEESFDGDGQTYDYLFTYAYDAAGNPTTFKNQTFTYNDNNQYAEDATYGITGDLTDFADFDLAYDGASHLLSANQTISCTYRGDGLRAKKVSGNSTTYYLYDGETLVAECDATAP